MSDRAKAELAWILPAAAVWVVNAVWLSLDNRPPVWDMALHQSYALGLLSGAGESGSSWWAATGNYPPFVHLLMAVLFRLFHPGSHIAALVNLPATALLLWAASGLASELRGPGAARWTCWVTALIPYMMWMSRETVLDYWLSAWVAASLLLLLRTRGFESHRHSLLLGMTLGFGLLTKWLFAALVGVPMAFVFARARTWRDPRRMIAFADAILVAGVLAAPWYLPNLPRLAHYFAENSRIGAREGEPPIVSFQSFLYYIRLLEGYQLFALLFAVVAVACVAAWRRKLLSDGSFLATAVIGGWAAMTLLRTKDPRFTMPLLPLLAVVAGSWIDSWGSGRRAVLARTALLLALGFQGYMANFGVKSLPREVVLARGYQGSLRWDWNLYLQGYFDILGPPRREDWKQAEILRRMGGHVRESGLRPTLALIPDLPRFNAANFQLVARMTGMPLAVDHLQAEARGLSSFDGFDYVVMIDGGQGMSWTTVNSAGLNKIVVDRHDVFRLLGLYPLPNGDYARLYFAGRGSRTAG